MKTMKTANEQRAQLVKNRLENNDVLIISWNWSVSKAYETEGYNICTCKIGSWKVGQCKGGGYDMQGDSLGQFLNAAYEKELHTLFYDKGSALYGYSKYEGKGYVNGSCGLSSVVEIFKALGFNVVYHYNGKNVSYIVSKQ